MQKYAPFVILALIFLFLKLPGAGIRISDTNIYFYTAYELLNGRLLYKDIFFTNFPLLPYFSVLYFILTLGNLAAYTFTAVFEVICAGFIIYKILLEKKLNLETASITLSLYFFSFITLTTSDHQTGVFLASVFSLATYYFYTHRKASLMGVFIGLCLMTKAYFFPVFIAFFLALLFEDRKKLSYFLTTFFLTIFLILVSFVATAPNSIYNNIFEYSLTRAQGVPKLGVMQFFAIHDFILILLFFYSILRLRQNIFFGLLSTIGTLFVIFYKDVYYLYLNFIVPFLCLLLPQLISEVTRKFNLSKNTLALAISFVLTVNIVVYLSSYQSLQKIENIDEMVKFLKSQDNEYIYGANDIAPALAYLSKKKLVAGVVDTNENIFLKGYLDGDKLTREAIANDALIVSHGMYYPQYNIDQPLNGKMFKTDLIEKKCKQKATFSERMEGISNKVNIFSCSKNE